MRIDPKLWTSIVEGISVFLSMFDDNPQLKRVFCIRSHGYAGSGALRGDGQEGTTHREGVQTDSAGNSMNACTLADATVQTRLRISRVDPAASVSTNGINVP